MSALGDNRLPTLAADIRAAHGGVLDAAKTAAERSIDAGRALTEAKALVPHGGWRTWLRDHCGLPERTAQLYMAIARTGLDSATVADLGLKAAAKVEWVIHDPDYNPFAHCDADGKREWHVWVLFLASEFDFDLDGAWRHTEWILQRQFQTPCEWLGDAGGAFQRSCGMREASTGFKARWTAWADAHCDLTLADISDRLASLPPPQPSRRKRRRALAS